MGCCGGKPRKPTIEELGKKYKLTEQQLATYHQSFSQFDKNGDGKISPTEMFDVMKTLGYKNITQAMINEMITTLDKDHSGFIEFDEFVQIMVNTPPSDMNFDPHQTSVLFSVFDKNKDGFISKNELRQTMLAVGMNLTEQQIKEMMDEVDTNKDGKISQEEFKLAYGKLMKKATPN